MYYLVKLLGFLGLFFICLSPRLLAADPNSVPLSEKQMPGASPSQLAGAQEHAEKLIDNLEDRSHLAENSGALKIEFGEDGLIQKAEVNGHELNFSYSKNSADRLNSITISSEGGSILFNRTEQTKSERESLRVSLNNSAQNAIENPRFSLSVQTNEETFERLIRSLKKSSVGKNQTADVKALDQAIQNFTKSYAKLSSLQTSSSVNASKLSSPDLEIKVKGFLKDLQSSFLLYGRCAVWKKDDAVDIVIVLS